jgi:hypothetical protein
MEKKAPFNINTIILWLPFYTVIVIYSSGGAPNKSYSRLG